MGVVQVFGVGWAAIDFPQRLLPFNRFEKRPEIPLSETAATLALDHLVKQRRSSAGRVKICSM